MRFPLNPEHFPSGELAKARRRHLVRQSVLVQRPLCGPMEVGVILTYRCNHGCTFCALPHEAGGRRGEMPADLLMRIVDELAAADCEQVSFTGGGEPTMHPALPELVERARAAGMACSVCTNGALIEPDLARHWARLGVHLAVSFNAAKKQTYQLVHRGAKADDYDRILDMLRAFTREAAGNGGEGSFVSLNFVIHDANVGEIDAMADLAQSVGASQIQYRMIQPREVHRDLMLSPEQADEARAAVRRVEQEAASREDFTVQIAQSLRTSGDTQEQGDLRPGVVPEAFFDDRTRVPCLEGYVASYIDADGTVFPCCLRSTDISNHFMGDLRESSFAEIWQGERYQAFRRESFLLDQSASDSGANSCAHCPKAKHFLYLVDEFAPGNYIDLLRRQDAALRRQLAQLHERVHACVALPPAAMKFDVQQHDLPAQAKPAETFVAQVTVRNASEATWPGSDLARDRAVGLGYHILDRRGRMVRFDNNPRAYLAEDVAPGGEATLALTVQAPEMPGRYQIELDMVQEQVDWFAQAGAATVRIQLLVQP